MYSDNAPARTNPHPADTLLPAMNGTGRPCAERETLSSKSAQPLQTRGGTLYSPFPPVHKTQPIKRVWGHNGLRLFLSPAPAGSRQNLAKRLPRLGKASSLQPTNHPAAGRKISHSRRGSTVPPLPLEIPFLPYGSRFFIVSWVISNACSANRR